MGWRQRAVLLLLAPLAGWAAGIAQMAAPELDWAAQKAATLGRTAAEAQELVQTVKKTGEVALTTMALTGLKKGVRAVKAPKPAIIKDALSERAVVKDGKVFLGERELGPVSSMPTTRTFAKPLDAALREEFQSGVFDREVAWRCNVDDRTYRIIRRNDIDPHRVVPGGKYAGKTNLDLMKQGLAPYNNAGQKVVLHHVNQKASGPFIETTRSAHTSELHGLFGPNKPHPTEPVHRGDFNKLREAYWRDYAESIK